MIGLNDVACFSSLGFFPTLEPSTHKFAENAIKFQSIVQIITPIWIDYHSRFLKIASEVPPLGNCHFVVLYDHCDFH